MDESKQDSRWTTILLVINLIIWSLIIIMAMAFTNIVNAASIDYNNTAQSIHKKSPTADWIVLQRNTDTSLNSTAVYDQVIVQFTGYQEGVAVGVVNFDITSATLATNTCRQLLSYITVTESHSYTGAVITSNGCAISGNRIRLSVKFETSVLGGTNGLLEMKLTKDFTLASNIKVYGSMTVEDVQNAKNTDIQEQTNVLTEIINSNTTNITNAINNSLTMCKNYNYMNTPIAIENKYLNETGLEQDLTGNHISEYIPIKANETYTLSINYSSAQNGRSYCIYREDKSIISCQRYTQASFTITPTVNGYVRYTINKTNNALTTEFTGRYCQDRTEAEIEELKVLQSLMHTEPWTDIDPDMDAFEDMEDSEDILHEYTDVDFEDVEIDLDSDTNNWVWSTLTALLNTNQLVFGMVISILSIGIGKLILGR